MSAFDKPVEAKGKEKPQESLLHGFEAAALLGDRSAFSGMKKQQEQQAAADAGKGASVAQDASKLAMLNGFAITGATQADRSADLRTTTPRTEFDINRTDGGYAASSNNRSFSGAGSDTKTRAA